MKKHMDFLKFCNFEDYDDFFQKSDQQKKIDPPQFQKEYPESSTLIDLIDPESFKERMVDYTAITKERISRRQFTEDPLSLEELSFLLWSTQGVTGTLRVGTFRTVPSSGGKSPFETYLIIRNVEGLKKGLYRYISYSHKLLFVKEIDDIRETVSKLSYGQKFVSEGAVVFCWVAVPYRTEWRYSNLSPKFIAIDLGVVCQSLYMACEAAGLGTVAIGYYEQGNMDEFFDLDGEEEFTMLIAPVGNVPKAMTAEEFFENPEANVSSEDISMLTGTYKGHGLSEVYIDDGKLYHKNKAFNQILTPYNKSEFYGQISKAVRFNYDSEGKPAGLEILSRDGAIFKLEKLE